MVQTGLPNFKFQAVNGYIFSLFGVTIVNKFYIFVIRAILGLILAVILSRFFYPQTNIVYISGLCIFLVGTAYILDYVRSNKQ